MLLEMVLEGQSEAECLCRVLSFRLDIKWFPDSVVTKDPMALIVRVRVLTPVSWLNSKSGHLIIPSFQFAHSSPL